MSREPMRRVLFAIPASLLARIDNGITGSQTYESRSHAFRVAIERLANVEGWHLESNNPEPGPLLDLMAGR